MVTRRNLFQGAGAVGSQLLLASMAKAAASGVNVKSLIEQKIDAVDNSLVFVEVVEFGPGVQSQPHRHPGPVFGYVLEGELLTQVEGSEPSTYKPGQAFYEPAGHVHLMAKNPSNSKPTRFLAMIIGKQGSPSVLAR
jgi:quercetin dioxygenase-like cupin family protein